MRRVVLTGGSGFVGANLARRLVRDGHEVSLLLRPGHRLWRIHDLRSDLRLHETDLGNRESLVAILRSVRPEWVFHLAAYGAYPSQQNLQKMIDTNFQGTVNLVEASLRIGFEAFVNTGSSSEYGFKDHAPSENECLEPNSHYAVTKASATLFCRQTAQSQSIHLPTLRLYSVYGPYEEPSRLMPALIRHGLEGSLPPLASPETARDYIYIDDVVEAYLRAAGQPRSELGPIYNVGTGTETTLREVVALARRVFQVQSEPCWGAYPARSWDTSRWVADSRKLQDELGWRPRYSFEDGFRTMAEWVRRSVPGLASAR